MIEVFAGFRIAAPAEQVWPLINWTGVTALCDSGAFFKAVRFSSSEVRAGTKRYFTPPDDGPEIVELLLHYDDVLRVYGYRVIDAGALPLADYEGRVCVTAGGPAECLLSFAARGIPVGLSAEQLTQFYQTTEARIAAIVAARLNTRVLS
jgi:hypothetical protein